MKSQNNERFEKQVQKDVMTRDMRKSYEVTCEPSASVQWKKPSARDRSLNQKFDGIMKETFSKTKVSWMDVLLKLVYAKIHINLESC